MTRISSAFASLLFLSGCASSWPTGVAENGYPILPRDSVVIYEVRADIPDAYEVLGVAESYDEANRRGATARVVTAEEIERMRRPAAMAAAREDFERRRLVKAQRSAAMLGANGVLVVSDADLDADPRLREALGPEQQNGRHRLVFVYVGTPPGASGDGGR